MDAFTRGIELWRSSLTNLGKKDHLLSQAYIYGLFCWIQDCQEEGSWIEISVDDALEGLEEFSGWDTTAVQPFHPIFLEACKQPLIQADEFKKLLDIVLQVDFSNHEISILSTLFRGEKVPANLLENIQEESVKETTEEVAPKEIVQEAAQPPQPPPIPQRPRRFAKTRRVKGRRSITPMKRHGFKSRTRNKHHKSIVTVILPPK